MSDAEECRDARPTGDIIAEILAKDYDDTTWELVTILRYRGTRDVFEAARKLTESPNPDERCLGVDILAQLGIPKRSFPDEVYETLANLLKHEEDEEVLFSICFAFNHNRDFSPVEALFRLTTHPSAEVRYAAANALMGHEDKAAVEALIKLSSDPDAKVRDWATFGLGMQIDLDTPEIREVLICRLDDEDGAVRGEALRGLAHRDDKRAIEPLIKELYAIAKADEWYGYAFEAAEAMPDVRLYPALAAVRESGIEDTTLDHAIALCRTPAPEEVKDLPTDAPMSCPVCWRRRAFRNADEWQFCKRCGWTYDPDQRANPGSAEGYNRRSLNQERERWRTRATPVLLD